MGDVPFRFPCFTVWTVGEQGIPNIDDGEDARGERDLGAFQSARISAPIPVFMVALGDIQRIAEVFDG